jgi:hypothetical protein
MVVSKLYADPFAKLFNNFMVCEVPQLSTIMAGAVGFKQYISNRYVDLKKVTNESISLTNKNNSTRQYIIVVGHVCIENVTEMRP